MKKVLAQVISLVFDPRVEIPALLVLAVMNLYSNGAQLIFLSLLMFIDGVLPLMFYLHLRAKKEISDWDITKRVERVPLYTFATIAHAGGVLLAWGFGQLELARVLGVFWFLAVMFTLVTSMWKVSIHTGVNGALVTFLWVLSRGEMPWVFAIVALVGWSRLELKKHGAAQVWVGGFLGVLGVLAGMRVVGL